jgi:hypothetical protein
MTDAIDLFVLSLEREAPPPGSKPVLRAVWHGLRGDWDAAHELAQAQDDTEGAWVHAWLHRIEGDLGVWAADRRESADGGLLRTRCWLDVEFRESEPALMRSANRRLIGQGDAQGVLTA